MLDDGCDGVLLYDDGDKVSFDDGSDGSTLDKGSDCIPLDDSRIDCLLMMVVMECTLIFGDTNNLLIHC